MTAAFQFVTVASFSEPATTRTFPVFRRAM
jgi:hypothetical protein